MLFSYELILIHMALREIFSVEWRFMVKVVSVCKLRPNTGVFECQGWFSGFI
jgi:hypothetical protein